MRRGMLVGIVLGCMFLVTLGGSAVATTVYYDEPTFLANVAPGYYLEDFGAYAYGSFVGPLLPLGPVNGFSYNITAPGPGGNDVWSNDSAMSTNSALDDLLVTATGNAVTAVGGFFFASDIAGFYIPGEVAVGLSDGTFETFSPPNAATFLGFTSGLPISTVLIMAPDPTGAYHWPTMDHFYVGEAIPEPATIVLLGVSLTGLALARRRRR